MEQLKDNLAYIIAAGLMVFAVGIQKLFGFSLPASTTVDNTAGLVALSKRVAALEKEIEELHKTLARRDTEIALLKREVKDQEQEIIELKGERDKLRLEMTELRETTQPFRKDNL